MFILGAIIGGCIGILVLTIVYVIIFRDENEKNNYRNPKM
jgi:hypothetical protein